VGSQIGRRVFYMAKIKSGLRAPNSDLSDDGSVAEPLNKRLERGIEVAGHFLRDYRHSAGTPTNFG
jgi:hypothetical protein